MNCKFKVALFVNPYINNPEDCKKHQFDKDNYAEIHTLEKTICPRHEDESEEKEEEEEVVTTVSSTCTVCVFFYKNCSQDFTNLFLYTFTDFFHFSFYYF